MGNVATITFAINGKRQSVQVDPQTPLVYVLRNDLLLKGVRTGCGMAVCGSCTVLLDGSPIRSCDTPVEVVEGLEITTPESLGTPDDPHPIQLTFLEEQAAQCGYCINGIIMSTVAATRHGDTVNDIDWLSEHLCRCGTHFRILRAIRRVLAGDVASVLSYPIALSTSLRIEGGTDVASDALPIVAMPSDRIESWIRLLPDGKLAVSTGKVELGQGIVTAIAQIVAAQIGISIDLITMSPTSTTRSPDEGYTAGSNSVDHGGVRLGAAAVAFRRLLLERAAAELGASPEELSFESDRIVRSDGVGMDLAELAKSGPIVGAIEPTDAPDWQASPLGSTVLRGDLTTKVTGSPAYVHDLDLPGMLHARAVLPPSASARLKEWPQAEVERIVGTDKIIRDDRMIIAVADREEASVGIATRLQSLIEWEGTEGNVRSSNLFDVMRSLPTKRYVERESRWTSPPVGHRATYSQPYQAHASIAPSCAVALSTVHRLKIWTHTQGVYPLRNAIASLTSRSPLEVEVVHQDGPGCYGQNLADDAAAFAAVAAESLPGTPIRFQFSAEQEFAWEPLGPAMIADLEASLGGEGHLESWSHRVLTDVHFARPDGRADRLIPSWLSTVHMEPLRPSPMEAGARNSVPIYEIPAIRAIADYVHGPLRTGALRGLGSYLNLFAAESFMDELAEMAKSDPVEFRLAHLVDVRARRVLRQVARHVGWNRHVGPSGLGRGLALARYKNTKAYVAAALEADIDQTTAEVSLRRIVIVCDAGTIINPDGATNQLEGGAVQGLSRALREEIHFDGDRVLNCDWLSYSVLPLGEVPSIEVVLLAAPGQPPLGIGEASIGPVAAALGNALYDRIGVRFRELPLTPQRIQQRLYDLTPEEAERVILD